MTTVASEDDLRHLKIKGYEPIAAYSGEEAVEKVRSDPPDCVLMDIKMTGINGVEALKQMQEIVRRCLSCWSALRDK